MENKEALMMPPAKYSSQREAIFVLIGRRYSFKPTNYFVPDFPIIDPSPDDPLSYLSERMLQLKIILQRRRNSYFVFWNRHPTIYSVLLHPMVYGLSYKIETLNRRSLSSRSFLVIRNHCFACKKQVAISNVYRRSTRELIKREEDIFPNFGKSGQGTVMRVSASYYESHVRFKLIEGELRFTGGGYANLLKEIIERMNFKYKLKSNGFGIKLKNGTYSGSVGDVYYGRSDIIGMMAAAESRINAIDMVNEGVVHRFGFVTGKPDVILEWNTVFKPFSFGVWIAILMSMSFLTALLRITVFFMRKPRFSTVFGIPKHAERQVLRFPALSILNQLNRCPVVPAIRPIATSWLFFSLIMYVLLGDHLMVVFLHPRRDEVPNSLDELLQHHKKNGYRMGYINFNDYGYYLFANAKSGTFKKVFDGLESFRNQRKCFDEAYRVKRLACITYEDGIEQMVLQDFTDSNGKALLHMSENLFHNMQIIIAARLGYPYGPEIRRKSHHATQAGLYYHYHKIEFDNYFKIGLASGKNRSSNSDDEESINMDSLPISMGHLFGIFIVLGAGLTFSSSVFLIERTYSMNDEWLFYKLRLLKSATKHAASYVCFNIFNGREILFERLGDQDRTRAVASETSFQTAKTFSGRRRGASLCKSI